MNLNGKKALVTGASRGIGREIALELARCGADVIVNFAGNEEMAKQTAEEIRQLGREGMIIQANVGVTEEVERMAKKAAEQFGTIDILVNNAGINKDQLLMRMKESDWDAVLNVDLKGVFLTTKALTRQMMRQRWGRIINISSVVGAAGNPGQANYAAAKAGIIGFTKSAARELASRNITVNAVAPGYITTDMTASLSAEIQGELTKQIPLGRLGEPTDIAKTVAFLASDDAGYITGQLIHVNGGMYM